MENFVKKKDVHTHIYLRAGVSNRLCPSVNYEISWKILEKDEYINMWDQIGLDFR